MMIAKSHFIKTFVLIYLMIAHFQSFGQQHELKVEQRFQNKSFYYDYRGTNVIDIAIGTSIANADLPQPVFDIAMRIGYKRYIFPQLNIGFSYNKFNLVFEDGFNEGFMSFDMNLEYIMLPNKMFTPFFFGGGGYNASNHFVQTATKFQGGGGFEFLISKKIGLKLMADYNYVLSDELDGRVFGASDDAYWRIVFGANIYFGGQQKKRKFLKGVPTIINSNPIIEKN